MKNKQTITEKLIKRKKIIFLILYLVVLPIVAIIGLYTSTYLNNKPKLFDEESFKVTDINKITEFDITFKVKEILIPLFDEKEKLVKSGQYKTEINLKNKLSSTIEIDSINVHYSFGCNWTNCEPRISTRTITPGVTTANTLTFSEIFPKKPLPLVKIEYPDIYLKIEWKQKAIGQTELESKKIFIRIPVKDYIQDYTVIRQAT